MNLACVFTSTTTSMSSSSSKQARNNLTTRGPDANSNRNRTDLIWRLCFWLWSWKSQLQSLPESQPDRFTWQATVLRFLWTAHRGGDANSNRNRTDWIWRLCFWQSLRKCQLQALPESQLDCFTWLAEMLRFRWAAHTFRSIVM